LFIPFLFIIHPLLSSPERSTTLRMSGGPQQFLATTPLSPSLLSSHTQMTTSPTQHSSNPASPPTTARSDIDLHTCRDAPVSPVNQEDADLRTRREAGSPPVSSIQDATYIEARERFENRIRQGFANETVQRFIMFNDGENDEDSDRDVINNNAGNQINREVSSARSMSGADEAGSPASMDAMLIEARERFEYRIRQGFASETVQHRTMFNENSGHDNNHEEEEDHTSFSLQSNRNTELQLADDEQEAVATRVAEEQLRSSEDEEEETDTMAVRSGEYGACTICATDEVVAPSGCLYCRNHIGCRKCCNRWYRRSKTNEADGIASCPLCRHKWEGIGAEIGAMADLKKKE
ncbi:hypothetical protein PFISCL1PPCAC_184, partial [Pristionchus fissidentatus]